MLLKLPFLLLALFALALFGISAQSDCKGKIGGNNYDLGPLANAVGDGDIQTVDSTGNTYYYRPCKSVSTVACSQGTNPPNPGTCQKDSRMIPRYHSCGSTSTATWKARSDGEATGFFLHFTSGEEDRQSDIEFVCDPAAGTGNLTAATPTEQPTHYYHLQWKSSLACPHTGGDGDGGGDDGGGISGGWIFIIILICLVAVYLIGGVIYKRFRTEDRGLDLIPQKDFWFSLPFLVKDGHMYIWKKARGLCGAQYETV